MAQSPNTLRLILGDQLNAQHSWFRIKSDSVTYLIAELHQEASYVKHHIQKLCAFFSAMQNFASALQRAGHQVIYLNLDESAKYRNLTDLIVSLSGELNIQRIECQRPDEFRLAEQMRAMDSGELLVQRVETEHFFLPFIEIDKYFTAKKSVRMESFYRKMRKRFDILMQSGEPLGGQWNFDLKNRNKLKRKDLEYIPQARTFENNISEIKARIDRHDIRYLGEVGESIVWPTSRSQAIDLLEYFCVHCLANFGTFQDAMTSKSTNAWSLYHSRLSFALNVKLISPSRVVERAIAEYSSRKAEIDIAQIEGFVRQIVGWREFVRGMYWANMPEYAHMNALAAQRDLPEYFWSGKTQMNCMKHAIDQSLTYSYAHHIQRLMITGNFCLLTGIDPSQVDEWYLGIYIDAIEWVEMPNTRGMCQFSDGGLVASKPYSASGAYINRMSDYCGDCHYNVKDKVGDQACPFNSLYWHFMHKHRTRLSRNPRIGMVYRNFDRMDKELQKQILANGDHLLTKLEQL